MVEEKNNIEEREIELHHASIEEIMGTPPSRISAVGNAVLCFVIAGIFIGAYFIKYEDKVQATAVLHGSMPHLILSPADGEVHLEKINKDVSPGDTLMWLSEKTIHRTIPILSADSGTLEVDPILYIKPQVKQSDVMGHVWNRHNNTVLCVIEIPFSERSRIVVGDKVRLHIDNYPTDHYGIVETTVKLISDFNSDSAVLLAELPEQITTSNSMVLTVRGNLAAQAEVVVGEQNIFHRLINPFRGKLLK